MAVNIFDLSGDDDYKLIRKNYFSDAIGCLLVYDVNIKSTFNNLTKWEQEAELNGLNLKNCIVVLIGNKIDVKSRREVSTKEGKEYATKKGFYFFETSSKTGVGVNDVFELVFNEMYVKTIDFKSKYLY